MSITCPGPRGSLENGKEGRWSFMNSGLSHHGPLRVSWAILSILILLTSAVFLAAQATFSAGPLLLHEVRTIYVAPQMISCS